MKFFSVCEGEYDYEYQFIEFTKNIINNYKNRNYLILNWVFHGGGATQSTKGATSIYEMTLFFIIRFLNDPLEKNLPFEIV